MSILEVKDLKKVFKDKQVIKGLTFNVNEGEILGILGPNGAGKTTTIQMLLGILTPTSGSVKIFNKDLSTCKSEILERVNFSSTYTDLPYRLTIKENLTWTSYLYDIVDRKKRLEKIKSLFRLEKLWERQLSSLSAGQRTRVNLARAYVNYPRLLLLDEPTASLDPEVALYIREFFAKQRQEFNTTIILTSHNMNEVESLCDTVMVLKDGEIIAKDTPKGLRNKLTTSHLRLRLIKGASKLSQLNALFTIENGEYNIELDEKEIPEYLSKLNSTGITYSEISIDKPTLEDYFLSVARNKL
ncbi:MAG: ABC transporter ATP-binding protein [bacterium]